MSGIEFEIKGIGKLIKENNLYVPIYQRPYSWGEKQVNDLFNDIKNSINESEYFLGTIVLTKNENDNRVEIVDGQQRITTAVIFFAALKEFFDQQEKEQIQKDYLSHYDYRTGTNIPKLELSQQDNIFFKDYIINNQIESEIKRESNRKIKETYDIAKDEIKKLLERHNNDKNALFDWMEFIDEKLKSIIITVPTGSNAFIIFETLNDRGLVLAQIDLLKNYLYSRADNRLSEVQNSWLEMIAKIENEDESIILTYIKHFWFANYGFTYEKNNKLYNDIKNYIRNSTQTTTFINNLRNDVDHYLAILNHNVSYWDSYDIKCKEYIETLNYFGLEQYRPLVFAILKKFTPDEIKKSLKLIVSWLVRNLIVGALGGGTLEKAYANKAKEIIEEHITKASELRESLKQLIPQDDYFKTEFEKATVSVQKNARYYLRAIENYKRGEQNPELFVNTNPDSVNLEHILPQKPGRNYPNFSEDDIDIYLKRIGNLTLMKTKENNEFKSSPFNVKKEKYKESELWITNSLADFSDWMPQNIENRQKELAKLAVDTWSLKFE